MFMRAALLVGMLVGSTAAHAGTISGEVWIDVDGDGSRSAGDEPLTGAAVFFETDTFARVDASGSFSLEAPEQEGVVWLKTTDRCAPGPVWEMVPRAGGHLLFLCDPAPTTPMRFVVASDTHTGLRAVSDSDLRGALAQAVDLAPSPRFLIITGDLTQTGTGEQFQQVAQALGELDVPVLPVPGNHDWYDEGVSYRQVFGPPSYSFDAGGVHFVVLNDSEGDDAQAAFLQLEAQTSPPGRLQVAFLHAPPPPAMVRTLADAGFDYLFTGHLHSNRILHHGELVEYNTQPLVMGGIDLSPAGFRVVTVRDSGEELAVTHRTVVNEPVIELVVPRPSDPVEGCEIEVIASVRVGAQDPRVHIVGGGQRVELTPLGGWNYGGKIGGLCEPGIHPLTVEVETAGGERLTRTSDICAAGPHRTRRAPAWPPRLPNAGSDGQLHLHPPLKLAWASSVGAELHGGAPAVGGGRVFVPVADFGDGSAGGVVALSLSTGEIEWRYQAGFGVRSAPAIVDGTVIATSIDGTVFALDAVSGEKRWSFRVGATLEPLVTSLYASAKVVEGVVYAGVQREFVALDLHTGRPQWTAVPQSAKGWFGSQASPAHGRGLIVSSFAGGGLGLTAWDSGTGELKWKTEPAVTSGMMASPVIDGETVYAINWKTELTALDLLSGETRWETQLDESSARWSYAVIAPPALADGVLYVGTQRGKVYAVDGESGATLWTYEGGESVIRPTHYQGRASSFGAAPVVSGALVWVGGADGKLTAIDRESGEPIWRDDLRAPVTSGMTPAGEFLIVATYDGVVRALRRSEDLVPADDLNVHGCPSFTADDGVGRDSPGCGCTGSRPDGGLGLLVLTVFLLLRRTSAHPEG